MSVGNPKMTPDEWVRWNFQYILNAFEYPLHLILLKSYRRLLLSCPMIWYRHHYLFIFYYSALPSWSRSCIRIPANAIKPLHASVHFVFLFRPSRHVHLFRALRATLNALSLLIPRGFFVIPCMLLKIIISFIKRNHVAYFTFVVAHVPAWHH